MPRKPPQTRATPAGCVHDWQRVERVVSAVNVRGEPVLVTFARLVCRRCGAERDATEERDSHE